MTFWDLLSSNWTKILGTISTVLSTLMALAANGSFDGLLEPSSIKWMAIVSLLLGAAITGVGFNNSSREKVAEAMQTAIKANPPTVNP
jgi:fructose-specific phosphotransferase system IIC component